MTDLLAAPAHGPAEAAPSRSAFVLRVHGPLSGAAVSNLRDRLRSATLDDRIVVIDCARVSEVDPVGAAKLWRLCVDLEGRGVRVRIADLPCRFSWRLRRHPILVYAASEDELFRDPFGSQAESSR